MKAAAAGTSRARIAAAAASLFLLVAATAALYWPCLDRPLIWDDHAFVGAQAFLHDPANLLLPLSPTGFANVLPVRGAGRPLWLSSVLSDPAAPGGPRRHRLVNLLWHAACGWVLLCLLLAMTGDLAASLAGALLFLAHPAHVETVVLVTFRADLMVFFFATAAAWLVYESGRVERGPIARAAALACVGLALLSKESAVVAPLLLYWVDPAKPGTWRKRLLVPLAVMLTLYVLFFAPRGGYVMSDRADALTSVYARFPKAFAATSAPLKPEPAPRLVEPMDPPPWSEGQTVPLRILSGVRAQGRALQRLVWPFGLSPDPAPRPARGLLDPGAWSAAALLAGLLWAASRLRAAAPLAAAGLAWIPLSLIPFMGFIAVKNNLGDRYLMFATAGLAMAACAALVRLPATRRRAGLAAAFLLAGVWAAAARARLPDYAGDEAFYRATLLRDPDAPRARLGLALVLADRNAPEAEAELRRAVEAWPGSRTARGYLASYLAANGRGPEAIDVLEALVREAPGDDAARWELARTAARFGRPGQAVSACAQILARRPDFTPAARLQEACRAAGRRHGPPERLVCTVEDSR